VEIEVTPKKRKFSRKYSIELLRIAEGDFDSAKTLSKSKEGRKENVLFLAQQSIEKCLKAVLCSLGEPILHTHDIEALLALLPDEIEAPSPSSLKSFTEYATVRRYEEGYEELTQADLKASLKLVQSVLVWAKAVSQENIGKK